MPPRRMRVIEAEPQRFSARLEARARQVVARDRESAWDTDPLDSVTRQLTLAVEEMDRARVVQEGLLKSTLHNECEMRTELHGIELRTPKYSPTRFPEREKTQRKLLLIDQERRRIVARHEEQMSGLRERLLGLLERHTQIE